MDFSDKNRLRLRSHMSFTSSITIVVLSSNATMEQYEPEDLLLMTHVQVPRTASLDDFGDLVSELLKKEFPNYSGQFACDCLDADVKRGTQQGIDMVVSRQVSVEEMTPSFVLSLIGRVFVMLKSPLMQHAAGRSSRPNVLRVDSRRAKKSSDLDHPPKNSKAPFECPGEDASSLASIDDEPMQIYSRPRASRGGDGPSRPDDTLNDTLTFVVQSISRMVV